MQKLKYIFLYHDLLTLLLFSIYKIIYPSQFVNILEFHDAFRIHVRDKNNYLIKHTSIKINCFTH